MNRFATGVFGVAIGFVLAVGMQFSITHNPVPTLGFWLNGAQNDPTYGAGHNPPITRSWGAVTSVTEPKMQTLFCGNTLTRNPRFVCITAKQAGAVLQDRVTR
jgi:hypothetical protein